MISDLLSQAINAALSHNWDKAVTLNQLILQENPADFDALNRLAYAFSELGRIDEAEEIFERVLALDPKNLLATKNLIKLRQLSSTPTESARDAENVPVDPNLFLEESGRTKTCQLIRIAAKEIIATLRTGYPVQLVSKNRSIAVFLENNKACVGYLPDDLAFSLHRLMDGGNDYEAYIKSVSSNLVTIFIRETRKGLNYKNIPSFLDPKKLHRNVTVKEIPSAHEKSMTMEMADDPEIETSSYDLDQ